MVSLTAVSEWAKRESARQTPAVVACFCSVPPRIRKCPVPFLCNSPPAST